MIRRINNWWIIPPTAAVRDRRCWVPVGVDAVTVGRCLLGGTFTDMFICMVVTQNVPQFYMLLCNRKYIIYWIF